MFVDSKYSKVLTVLLIVVIIGIVGLQIFLADEMYYNYYGENETEAFMYE